MEFKSDIQIAQENLMEPIDIIAGKAGIPESELELYGNYKAKVNLNVLEEREKQPDGKLILVTAVSPTPAGEGKTTTAVGLADALSKLNKRTMLTLREPSLGPVFGIKGGAAGGGYAQLVPMEDINLHFTGDMHAIGAANNLLAAMLDNHIKHGNELNIDLGKIIWKRCVDMNDRQLRFVVNGLGGNVNGVPREDGYDITVASEVMAVLCLAADIEDLKKRLGNMVIAYSRDDKPVTASMIRAEGAMAALLKDAIKPNLVQSLEHTPAFVHGGPFANIAHGCNTIIATRMALKLADYVVTEAGFGADLGAEKFIDIKSRMNNLRPSAVVVVATVRALKHHGGVKKENLTDENLPALEAGLPNLLRHVDNMKNIFNLPTVVAINKFPADTVAELALISDKCAKLGVNVVISDVWANGGAGGTELAKSVVNLCELDADNPHEMRFAYDLEMSIVEKIEAIAKKIYRAAGVHFTKQAYKQIAALERDGFDKLPICMAKTQYSFSDDMNLISAPENFEITVRNLKVSAGAGFIVALAGDIMTMPGLPKRPAAEKIDIDASGKISGLF